jgi:hypothetical protein
VDLGLRLPDAPESDRILDGKNVGGGSITHRVPLENLDDVDGEALAWLALAYTRDV